MDLARLERALAHYTQERGVSALYLFGSAAQGTLTPLSDIDIAVLLPDNVSPDEYFDRRLQMTLDLMRLLNTDKIDLVILNQAPPLLKYQVVTQGKPLYSCDQGVRQRFEARAITEYLDFKPVLELQFEYLQRRIKEGQFGVRQSRRARALEKA